MPTHLVWDWNGTLLDDVGLMVEATNAALGSVGRPSLTVEEYQRGYRAPIESYHRKLLGRSLGTAQFTRLNRLLHTYYRDRLTRCPLAPDAVEALNAWTGTQSLLSQFYYEYLLLLVNQHGLTRYFSRIDGLHEKPGATRKSGHLKTHLDALSLAGGDCVLIGDSLDDAAAARAVGAACVLYAGGFNHAEQLAATGLPVATTLVGVVALARTATPGPARRARRPAGERPQAPVTGSAGPRPPYDRSR